jgi:hypothetical protein
MATNIMYVDRKGEPGKMSINHTPTFSGEAFKTFFEAKSYAGLTKHSSTVETAFVTPASPGIDNIVNNDKDFKAILGFEGAEGKFKIEIPCPKINIEGGFVVRWGQNRAYIPPVKVPTETGDDGSAIQAAFRSITGDNTIVYKYGRLKKAV